ncbi:MAG: hypothetical protein DHS20C05_04360 [Hyphococcus sp.]|nr:MAG: hypothetical protein DHS20C05_04360 [Marinicaulis sp.]
MLNVLADDAKDVEAAILQFAEAYRSGDVAAVDQLIAEDYSHINNGGEPIDRTDYMAWNNLRAGHLKKGEWRIDQYEVTELVITTHELSAVATGRVIAKGERNGKQWNSDVRFTNLWIKESGHWRRAGFHDTALDKVE